MDTIAQEQSPVLRRRRHRHSETYRAQVVKECQRPGISVAAIALSHGLNANLVRRWIRLSEQTPASPGALAPSSLAPGAEAFVALPMPQPTTASSAIEVQLRGRNVEATVRFPSSSTALCLAWLGELLR